MTPKKKMLKTTVGLARALKPTGRLNVDDIKRAGDARKKISLSQIKDAKKLGRAAQLAKSATKAAGMMGVAGSMKGIKELMKKVGNAKKRTDLTKAPSRRAKPASVISRRRARVKR